MQIQTASSLIKSKRPDFTTEELKISHTLDGFASQIKDLGNSIRRDRKELDHNHPLVFLLAELEDIILSFSDTCGGYWQDVTLYPTFDSFLSHNIKYFKKVLRPSIKKLKKAKIPKEGEKGSGMSNQFLSYLERVENIYKLLLEILEKSKKSQGFTSLIKHFLGNHWKWVITTLVAIIGISVSIIFNLNILYYQRETKNNLRKLRKSQNIMSVLRKKYTSPSPQNVDFVF